MDNIQVSFDLRIDDPICIQKSTVNKNSFHRHNFLEIAYISRGSAIHHLGDKTIKVSAGDYFAINYNEIHRFQPAESRDFEVINILFRPEFISPTLKDCRGFPDLIANTTINVNFFSLKTAPTSIMYRDEDGEVLRLFDKMYDEYAAKRPQYFELLRCYLSELIIITLRKILKTENELAIKDETLNVVLNYINKNYNRNIRLKDICAELGYTPSYISALFSKTTGITFRQYLQNTRMSHACDMLANTQMSIDEIASSSGYNDIKFFRQIFKNYVGMSPSEFRSKSHNKKIPKNNIFQI